MKMSQCQIERASTLYSPTAIMEPMICAMLSQKATGGNAELAVPKQHVPGGVAPFIVGADGPDPLLFSALDELITGRL